MVGGGGCLLKFGESCWVKQSAADEAGELSVGSLTSRFMAVNENLKGCYQLREMWFFASFTF